MVLVEFRDDDSCMNAVNTEALKVKLSLILYLFFIQNIFYLLNKCIYNNSYGTIDPNEILVKKHVSAITYHNKTPHFHEEVTL